MFYNYDIDQVLREHLDISNKVTRKYLVSLDEEDKTAVATSLASALYDKIVKNVDKIDFGSIPKSMGDITKVDGFANTIECLDIIKKLVIEYKQPTEVVDTVINAIENIKSRKSTFMKAFSLKANLPINVYNLIVLSIEHSVSFLISVCIEYIKNNENNTIEMAVNKTAYNNAHDNLLFEQLDIFNKSCGSGELDSCFAELLKGKPMKEDSEIYISSEEIPADTSTNTPDYIPSSDSDGSELFSGEYDDQPTNIQPVIPEDNNCSEDVDFEFDEDDDIDYDLEKEEIKPAFETPVVTNEVGLTTALFIGGVALAGGALALKSGVYIIKILIPKLRNLSYFFISSRVKTSDMLALQAYLIEMNAYNVQYNETIDSNKRDKIVSKQLKIANNLKKWSNKFAIDNKTAEKKAKEAIKQEDKNIDINDIKDNIPNSEVLF
jgi:hypothetical protein